MHFDTQISLPDRLARYCLKEGKANAAHRRFIGAVLGGQDRVYISRPMLHVARIPSAPQSESVAAEDVPPAPVTPVVPVAPVWPSCALVGPAGDLVVAAGPVPGPG